MKNKVLYVLCLFMSFPFFAMEIEMETLKKDKACIYYLDYFIYYEKYYQKFYKLEISNLCRDVSLQKIYNILKKNSESEIEVDAGSVIIGCGEEAKSNDFFFRSDEVNKEDKINEILCGKNNIEKLHICFINKNFVQFLDREKFLVDDPNLDFLIQVGIELKKNYDKNN